MSWDKNMAMKENERGADNQSFADSNELFETIFRNELGKLRKDKAKKVAHGKVTEPGEVKHERPLPKGTAEGSKTPKPKGDQQTNQIKTVKNAPKKEAAKGSNARKLALLLVLMFIGGAVFVYSHVLEDIDFFAGIWEPSKKKVVQRHVPTKQDSEPDNKPTQPVIPAPSNQAPTTTAPELGEEERAQMPSTLAKEEPDMISPEVATEEVLEAEENFIAQQSPPVQEIQPREKPEKRAMLQVNSSDSYPYSIYLGSYKTLGRAKKAVSSYQEKGLSTYRVKVDLGAKGVWYRVYVGYFKTRADAELFIRKNGLAEAESKHTRYANLIGVYESGEELETKRNALIALGCDPYVIRAANGESLLYSGAFYQKGRAEKEHSDLTSKGIQAQLVER